MDNFKVTPDDKVMLDKISERYFTKETEALLSGLMTVHKFLGGTPEKLVEEATKAANSISDNPGLRCLVLGTMFQASLAELEALKDDFKIKLAKGEL